MSIELRKNIRKWNQADVKLYEFFNASLWTEISYEGEEFWRELEEFREAQKGIEMDCLRENKDKSKYFLHDNVKGESSRGERKADIFRKLFNIHIDFGSGKGENKMVRRKRTKIRELLHKGRLLTDEDEIQKDFFGSGESSEKEEKAEVEVFNNNETKLNSQVSKWNEHFCKKLLQDEQDYLGYFRKKHAYARSLLKHQNVSN